MPWSDMHFLRPWWLLLIGFAVAVFIRSKKAHPINSPWAKVIDKKLLPYVMRNPYQAATSRFKYLWPLFFVVLAIALAGPTIEKLPTDVHYTKAPVIIALEVTPEMQKNDIAPTRLRRAVYKIADFLEQYHGAEVALIAFAGDAHVVVPLTEDYNTIMTLAKTLSPEIMPKAGVDIKAVLDLAQSIVERHAQSKLLIITSNSDDKATLFAKDAGIAPIVWRFGPTPSHGVSSNAQQIDFSIDDKDLKAVMAALASTSFNKSSKSFAYDSYRDLGPYVLWAALIIFMLAFFMSLGHASFLLLAFLLHPLDAESKGFFDWFLNRDQQAKKAVEQGDFKQAATLYQDDFNKGSAYYRAKMYDEAIAHFKRVATSDGYYNLGNALAHKQQYQEAIAAYNEAISRDPLNNDAKENKKLLSDLMQKQEQKQEQESPPKNEQEKDDKKSQDSEKPEPKDQKQQEQDKDKKGQDAKESHQQKPAKDKQDKEAKAPEAKQSEQKDHEPSMKPLDKPKSSTPDLDRKTQYHFEKLEQHNSHYLKRKFYYESEKKSGAKK